MKTLSFNTIGDGTSYPNESFVGQDDQSYGFQPAFKLQTGNLRGTQGVGYGGVQIDGANNRIIIKNTDGTSIGLGTIPGTTKFGFFSLNTGGQLIYSNVNGTQTYYNPVDSYNPSILMGGSPDNGRTGIWTGKVGQNVITLLGG